jgi:hypothetical protein
VDLMPPRPPEFVTREAAGLERFADVMRAEGWDRERVLNLPYEQNGYWYAQATAMHQTLANEALDFQPGRRLLDVGSNTCWASAAFAERGLEVVALDIAAIPLQGLLKTASIVTLFFPLLVLAVPIVDTTFVVARRLKHGERVFEADQAHLHHRFLRRGFSEPRAALTIWSWCISLAAAALATRFVPFRAHGVWHVWPTVVAAAIALVAVAFSVYVVYVLEIVKIGNPISRRRLEGDPLRKSA